MEQWMSRRPRGGERGHLLIAVIVGVAMLLIFSTVAIQPWSMTWQRDNEDELIFRGQQIAMALKMFQKFNGRFPTDLKELEQEQGLHGFVLRRPWKDPMTEKGEWGCVYVAPQGGMVTTAGAQENQQIAGGIGQQVPTGLATTVAGLPIIGVHSLSDKEPIGPHKWRGGMKYSEWQFTANDVGQGSGIVPPGDQPPSDDEEVDRPIFPGTGGTGGGLPGSGGGRGGPGGGNRPGGGRPGPVPGPRPR